jgi:hypothetical protein
MGFIVVAISTFIAVGLLEVGVRIGGIAPETAQIEDSGLAQIIEGDPLLELRYRPNAETTIRSAFGEYTVGFRTDPQGFRARDDAAPPAGGRHGLVLGNSFVEGWAVNERDSFVRVAERALRSGGADMTLDNAGISGYGGAQLYLLAKRLLAERNPDIVLFVLVGTMVPADATYLSKASFDAEGLASGLDISRFLAQPEGGGAAGSARPAEPWLKRLSEYSALARLVYVRLNIAAKVSAIVPGDPKTDMLAVYRAKGDAEGIFAPTLRYVSAIERQAKQRGAAFQLIYLPMPFQLSSVEWDLGRSAYGDLQASSSMQDRIVVGKFCELNAISCSYAADALRSSVAHNSSDRRLFYRYDFHPNQAGNEVLGNWVAEVIRQGFAQ